MKTSYIFRLSTGFQVVVDGYCIKIDGQGYYIKNEYYETICYFPCTNVEYWHRQDANVRRI